MADIKLYNVDCIELMKDMEDGSLDIILIDPPYLYLKNQKLERPFDEQLFFSECKRLLTKNGFVIMFGRGESFYRWNTRLADLGFVFKEEIIWDKKYISSPLLPLSRVHETISIFSKGNGSINRSKIPYLEMKKDDLPSILQDLKRMRTILKNNKSLKSVEAFLENNTGGGDIIRSDLNKTSENGKNLRGDCNEGDRCVNTIQSISFGLNEKTIIRTDMELRKDGKGAPIREGLYTGDRAANVMQSIDKGLNEKTIIKQGRDHYSAIHPTQKPVRLLVRLLKLVLPKKKTIRIGDFFGGSFSTMEAVYELQTEFPDIEFEGISCEVDEEYFNVGKKRIDALAPVQQLLFQN